MVITVVLMVGSVAMGWLAHDTFGPKESTEACPTPAEVTEYRCDTLLDSCLNIKVDKFERYKKDPYFPYGARN